MILILTVIVVVHEVEPYTSFFVSDFIVSVSTYHSLITLYIAKDQYPGSSLWKKRSPSFHTIIIFARTFTHLA